MTRVLDPTSHPAYRDIAEVARTVLAPRAVEVDATEVPRSHLDILREVGYFGWVIGEEFGGTSIPQAVLHAINELLYGTDPSTATIVTQHRGPVTPALKAGTPEAVALVKELASGDRIGGAGFGHVRSYPKKPGALATRSRGGWRLNGRIGWISGIGLVDTAWLGAVHEEDQTYVFAAADLRAPGVTGRVASLASVQGSRTGSLDLTDFFVPDALVGEVVPIDRWKADDGIVPFAQADRDTPARTSFPPAGPYGLARAALDDALALHPGSPDLQALSDELETAYATVLPQQQWRAVLDEICVRATTAALVARGGSGLLADDIAQVRVRAAQFFQIRSIGPVVRAAHLARYRRPS